MVICFLFVHIMRRTLIFSGKRFLRALGLIYCLRVLRLISNANTLDSACAANMANTATTVVLLSFGAAVGPCRCCGLVRQAEHRGRSLGLLAARLFLG